MKDNKIMQLILSFFAEHSPSIIKLLSIVVAIAASILLYRVIFVQNVGAVEQRASTDLLDVNKRLSEQKIEIETLKSETETAKIDLEKQRTEVYNLRQTIKEKETEVEVIKAENQQLKNQSGDPKKLDYEKHQSEMILSTADENLVFQKEIAELKRRLTDYEIIAEDIADIQRLKEENDKLKQLVGAGSPEMQSPDPVNTSANNTTIDTTTSALSESPSELELDQALAEMNQADVPSPAASEPTAEFKNPSADAPIDFIPNEKSGIETEVLEPGPGDNSANIDDILETARKAAEAENLKNAKTKTTFAAGLSVETETIEGVSEVDKNLLDKFEKQKET